MLEGASDLRGGVTKANSLVRGVLRVGRLAKAKILLRRFSAITE